MVDLNAKIGCADCGTASSHTMILQGDYKILETKGLTCPISGHGVYFEFDGKRYLKSQLYQTGEIGCIVSRLPSISDESL